MHIWLRAESRTSETRSALTPRGAGTLMRSGHFVTVERSRHRAFPDDGFGNEGCRLVEAGSWVRAPKEAYILGLKELPELPGSLVHRHIYFGHAYKGQENSTMLLSRFRAGGGQLLDLEYLRDEQGRRSVAFGHWAGYVGAALGLIQYALKSGNDAHAAMKSLLPFPDVQELEDFVRANLSSNKPRVLIIGGNGRSGRGATKMCEQQSVLPTVWGRDETRCLDRQAILDHDVLINCVLVTEPIEPFLRSVDINGPRRLSVISDVTCEQGSVLNPLPALERGTSWESPVRSCFPQGDGNGPLHMLAIDNLASLLPVESSVDFGDALLPHLLNLSNEKDVHWDSAREMFDKFVSRQNYEKAAYPRTHNLTL